MAIVLLLLYFVGIIAVRMIAFRKNRNVIAWSLLAVVLPGVALGLVLAIGERPAYGMKPCPFCYARIPEPATVCSHCGRDVTASGPIHAG